ncbi:hypothetical protein LTS08_004652 [Lithohypha guttulata]|nr:hypothetical protein LTS08_004652 [Lithohypha guttulata]
MREFIGSGSKDSDSDEPQSTPVPPRQPRRSLRIRRRQYAINHPSPHLQRSSDATRDLKQIAKRPQPRPFPGKSQYDVYRTQSQQRARAALHHLFPPRRGSGSFSRRIPEPTVVMQALSPDQPESISPLDQMAPSPQDLSPHTSPQPVSLHAWPAHTPPTHTSSPRAPSIQGLLPHATSTHRPSSLGSRKSSMPSWYVENTEIGTVQSDEDSSESSYESSEKDQSEHPSNKAMFDNASAKNDLEVEIVGVDEEFDALALVPSLNDDILAETESDEDEDSDDDVIMFDQLSFQVTFENLWGQTETQNCCIRLSSGSVQRYRVWAEEQTGQQRRDFDGKVRSPIPRTLFRRHPPEKFVFPAFLELWDHAHKLQENHLKAKKRIVQLKGKVESLSCLLEVPDPMLQNELFAVEHEDTEPARARENLQEPAQQPDQGKFAKQPVHEVQQQQLRNSDAPPQQVSRLETHTISLGSDKKIDVHESSWQDQLNKLKSESQQLRDCNFEMKSYNRKLQNELQLSIERHAQSMDRSKALQKVIEAKTKVLSKKTRQLSELQKRNAELVKALRTHDTVVGAQQEREGFDAEYLKVRRQRDRSLQTLDHVQTSMHQTAGCQAARQQQIAIQREHQRLTPPADVASIQEQVTPFVKEAGTPDTMEQLKRLRNDRPDSDKLDAAPISSNAGARPSTTAKLGQTDHKKSRPAPIKRPMGKPRNLEATEITRSFSFARSLPGPSLGHPMSDPATNKSPVVQSKTDPLEAPGEDVSIDSSATSKVIVSPKLLAGQDSIDVAHQFGDLTALWKGIDQSNYVFNDTALILYNVYGMNRSKRTQLFSRGDYVYVAILVQNDFWLVKADTLSSIFILPRTAATLVCPHGQMYCEIYEVVYGHEVDDEDMHIFLTPLISLPHPPSYGKKELSFRFVHCAHSQTSTGPFSDGFGELYRCVRTLGGEKNGWYPAISLSQSPVSITDYAPTLCPCSQSQLYTSTADVLKDCHSILTPFETKGTFSLYEHDLVDVAHLHPQGRHLYCIRHRKTGQRGWVDASNLRVHRQPVANEHGDIYYDITPRLFDFSMDSPMGGQNWSSKDYSRSYEMPTGYKDIPVRRYDNWRTGPPIGKYVAYNDYMQLPRPWKDTLAVNRFGPRRGRNRARPRSLIHDTEYEHRLIKRNANIGWQPKRTIADSQLLDRDYDSDPVTKEARSRKLKYEYRINSRGHVIQVLAANPDEYLDGPWSDRNRNDWISNYRGRGGNIDERGLAVLNAMMFNERKQIKGDTGSGDDATEAESMTTQESDRMQYDKLAEDWERGYDLVYQLSDTSSKVYGLGKTFVRVFDLSDDTLVVQDIEYLNRKFRVPIGKIDAFQPLLRTATTDHQPDTQVILLERFADDEGEGDESETLYLCVCAEEVHNWFTRDLHIEDEQHWQSLEAVLQRIREAQESDKVDLPTPPVRDWDLFYTVLYLENSAFENDLQIQPGEPVYLDRSESAPSGNCYCRTQPEGKHKALFEEKQLDMLNHYLRVLSPAADDPDLKQLDYVIVLKKFEDKYCCSLPGQRKKWFSEFQLQAITSTMKESHDLFKNLVDLSYLSADDWEEFLQSFDSHSGPAQSSAGVLSMDSTDIGFDEEIMSDHMIQDPASNRSSQASARSGHTSTSPRFVQHATPDIDEVAQKPEQTEFPDLSSPTVERYSPVGQPTTTMPASQSSASNTVGAEKVNSNSRDSTILQRPSKSASIVISAEKNGCKISYTDLDPERFQKARHDLDAIPSDEPGTNLESNTNHRADGKFGGARLVEEIVDDVLEQKLSARESVDAIFKEVTRRPSTHTRSVSIGNRCDSALSDSSTRSASAGFFSGTTLHTSRKYGSRMWTLPQSTRPTDLYDQESLLQEIRRKQHEESKRQRRSYRDYWRKERAERERSNIHHKNKAADEMSAILNAQPTSYETFRRRFLDRRETPEPMDRRENKNSALGETLAELDPHPAADSQKSEDRSPDLTHRKPSSRESPLDTWNAPFQITIECDDESEDHDDDDTTEASVSPESIISPRSSLSTRQQQQQQQHLQEPKPLSTPTYSLVIYWLAMLWMFISMYAMRREWLDVNGVGMGAQLVKNRRDAYSGGGWEWAVWEMVKRRFSEW